MLCLALDIGGSSVKSAVCEVTAPAATITRSNNPVPIRSRAFSDLRALVIQSVGDALEAHRDLGVVAISTTGAVDRSGMVLGAGHFDGYEDVSWSEILRERFPRLTKVVTSNDGKAATWAEYLGKPGSSEVFAHFVVGTGVGGGLVCFDQLLYGDDETAGALGHMKVELRATVECSCGRTGCVETVASGPAIARAFESLGGVAPHNDLEFVTRAALAGDTRALTAFETAGQWLGVAIANVINVLNPRFVTVGGGVVLASTAIDGNEGGPYLRAAARRARSLAFEGIGDDTVILPARFGNDGGLIGAALLSSD